MILYSNYELDVEGARQFLFETDEEGRWASPEDIPECDVYMQAEFDATVAWDDFEAELSSFLNGNHWIVYGSCGLWNGRREAGRVISSLDELYDAWKDCDFIEFEDDNGRLTLRCAHHDGTNHFEVRRITEAGMEALEKYGDWCDTHRALITDPRWSELPCFAEKVYGIVYDTFENVMSGAVQ